MVFSLLVQGIFSIPTFQLFFGFVCFCCFPSFDLPLSSSEYKHKNDVTHSIFLVNMGGSLNK